MEKNKGIFRIFSLMLAVLTIVSLLTVSLPSASAAEVTKAEKNYDIAVVFDNSHKLL